MPAKYFRCSKRCDIQYLRIILSNGWHFSNIDGNARLGYASRRWLMALLLIDRVDSFGRVIAGMRVKAQTSTTLPTLPVKTSRRNLPLFLPSVCCVSANKYIPALSWLQGRYCRLYNRSSLRCFTSVVFLNDGIYLWNFSPCLLFLLLSERRV